eukprot:5439_1
MAGSWGKFGGLAAASGSALCLNRLLEVFPLQSESAQDSSKYINKTAPLQAIARSSFALGSHGAIEGSRSKAVPQTWKSLDHTTARMIKRRTEGESGALHVLSGSAYPEIATEVSGLLGVNLTKCKLGTYADGECSVEIIDPVSAGDIFIIAPTHTDNCLMELLLMISAVRRVGVKRITAVIPYFGYSRQDVRTKREPVAASDVANMLQAMGIDRMISVDMHSPGIQGFFGPEISVEHLSTAQLAADYYSKKITQKLKDGQDEGGTGTSSNKRIVVVASQDGHVTRASDFASCLDSLIGGEYSVNVALVSRSVDYSDDQQLHRTVVGDTKGADCIIIDDIISTGETLQSAVNAITAEGAASISAFATHGRFSQGGKELVNTMSELEELVICDTVPQPKTDELVKDRLNVVNVLSVAPLLAEAIFRAHGKIPMKDILYSASQDDHVIETSSEE